MPVSSMAAFARHATRLGTTIESRKSRYALEQLLGWGSTSAVYEATSDGGARFAVKILHRSLCGSPGVVERFLREAYVSGTVQHRSIVTVRDDGDAEGSAFLVLDLLDGETLEERRLRQDGRLGVDEVLPIAFELTSALEAVHAHGIVPRDLKPQNVFMTDTGALKLIDFGTALVREPKGEGISVEGLVIGTPSFMSPEQARGERSKIDARSDVWSLGATLFTILAGEYVHVGRDAHQRLLAAATRAPRSLSAALPAMDRRLVALVDRALAFAKEDRWPDMVTLHRALDALAKELAAEAAPPSSRRAG